MDLRHAVWTALRYPEARMAFTVHHPEMGHNYGIGSGTVVSYSTEANGTATVVDQVTANPESARHYTFRLSDVVSWSFKLETHGMRGDDAAR